MLWSLVDCVDDHEHIIDTNAQDHERYDVVNGRSFESKSERNPVAWSNWKHDARHAYYGCNGTEMDCTEAS